MESEDYKPRNSVSSVRLSTSKPHFTETIYMKQKKRIAEILNEYRGREQPRKIVDMAELK